MIFFGKVLYCHLESDSDLLLNHIEWRSEFVFIAQGVLSFNCTRYGTLTPFGLQMVAMYNARSTYLLCLIEGIKPPPFGQGRLPLLNLEPALSLRS